MKSRLKLDLLVFINREHKLRKKQPSASDGECPSVSYWLMNKTDWPVARPGYYMRILGRGREEPPGRDAM